MLKTEAQRVSLCTHCPIAKVADLVGDSCVLLLVRDLLTGTRRFGDFEKSLHGISSRTITEKLRHLEERGLLERNAFNERPPRVEYSLTPLGKRLGAVIKEMEKYGKSL